MSAMKILIHGLQELLSIQIFNT